MQTIVEEKKKDAISESLGHIYDLAIDHAIDIVRQSYEYSGSIASPWNVRVDALVAKLKNLKK